MTNLATMKTNLAIDLSYTQGTEVDEDEVGRAVDKATDEISRFIPQQLVAELHFNKTVTAEAFNASTSEAVVTLSNKPIKPLSEAVTLAADGTEYTRNTDYEMDYINGTIITLTAGSITDGVALLVTYDRDTTLFDISSLLTRPIRIVRVEYTIQGIPHDIVSFDWHGDFLEIVTSAHGSQPSVGDDQNIRIYYEAYHTPPATAASGSFERYLDEVCQTGAAGFALRSAAMGERWLANAAIVSAKVETALANAALDQADADLVAAGTTIAVMRGSAGEPYDDAISTLVLAKTALDLVAAELTTDMNGILDTAVTNIDAVRGVAGEPYDEALAQLVTQLAEITDLDTAADSINAFIVGVTNSIHEALELIPGLILAMNTDIDNVAEALETDTENANLYMSTGDAFLNTVNTGGPNVPVEYLEYARTKIQAAQTWVSGAGMRGRNIEMRLAEAQGRIGQVQSLIGETEAHLSVITAYQQNVRGYLDSAATLINETNTRVGIANARRTLADGHIAEASQRITQAQGYINTASLIIQETTILVNRAQVGVGLGAQRIGTAASYLLAADTNQAAADKLMEESDRRLGEFRNTLRDKIQVDQGPSALASRRQYQ